MGGLDASELPVAFSRLASYKKTPASHNHSLWLDCGAMHIEPPDSQIVCDDCGQAQVESEAVAEARGWLVGRDSDLHRHIHICPACREATA